MTDRYASFVQSGAGRALVKRLGLPDPPRLRRHAPGDPLLPGPALLGAATGGRLAEQVGEILTAAGVELRDPAGVTGEERFGALVYDATGVTDSTQLRQLYDFFHPYARSVLPSGRVVVLGTAPDDCGSPREATAQRGLEGLTRSIGKEFGRGVTAQLVYVTPAGDAGTRTSLESTLRFLLSGRSAYVSGQVVRVGTGRAEPPADWDRPLDGQVVLVTGAARGIGAALARVLARDGAQVVALDVPSAGDELAAVVNEIGAAAVQLDLTAPDAPTRLAEHLASRHGRVDVVVHNAGITRDKTLGRMDVDRWDAVLDINLSSQERINDVLLERDLIPAGGRIVSVSSIAGIAGNRGQTNYATSKAGVIGLVESLAPALRDRQVSVNAVAPGFIETRLTARIPLGLREAGRRMNSLSQGGLPVDVAETIGWLAWPASGAVSGNVVRVCGQSLLGA
ncbi:3-oxoacyl-ACP reductase [Micromonospora endolithica]|uniref:3-oxoacyl-ACP reductase n=1 Tax=Micromonospora endolithica TaxID=230091 RepID=A0A3A9ZIJ0_9ACTN|nr:3-oxoacyl-ACP reductase [Micromonospora endolithica]RKN48241.1 3-oxoacyl-ACP reductase [Micromonospora endolithica]TWJ24712.1 3-oxoacyl-[acyl-carrier protein] reductase [Micromonospora endolithica]